MDAEEAGTAMAQHSVSLTVLIFSIYRRKTWPPPYLSRGLAGASVCQRDFIFLLHLVPEDSVMTGQGMMLSRCRWGGPQTHLQNYRIWWNLQWLISLWLESTTGLWPLGFWCQLRSLPLDLGTERRVNRGVGQLLP